MRISIVTVCRNSAATIRDTIESVVSQSYRDLEYIVIDGESTDGTIDIVQEFREHIDVFVSEPDGGLWDAMNKGIANATGDIIGFLNSDDFLAHEDVMQGIAKVLEKRDCNAVFGFVDIIDRDAPEKIMRRYRVSRISKFMLAFGLMPAHPSFYCSRQLFENYGGFLIDQDIAPDFELVARFLVRGDMQARLIPEVMVKMRTGGASNSSNIARLMRNGSLVESCRRNGIRSSSALMWLKWPYRIWEYLRPA